MHVVLINETAHTGTWSAKRDIFTGILLKDIRNNYHSNHIPFLISTYIEVTNIIYYNCFFHNSYAFSSFSIYCLDVLMVFKSVLKIPNMAKYISYKTIIF